MIERKQIELALERSEERFRVALAPAPIIVAEQDAELRYTWVYDPSSRFSGRDAVGKTDADLFPVFGVCHAHAPQSAGSFARRAASVARCGQPSPDISRPSI